MYRCTCNIPVTIIPDEAAALEKAKNDAAALLEEVSNVNEKDYTDENYRTFAAAKAALEQAIADGSTADSAEVKAAIAEVETAYANLVRIDPEEQARAQAVSDAKAYLETIKNTAQEDYTEESYAAFAQAKEALAAVIADGSTADSAAIRTALEKLKTAYAALEKAGPGTDPAVEPSENTLVVTPAKKTLKLKVKALKQKTTRKKICKRVNRV